MLAVAILLTGLASQCLTTSELPPRVVFDAEQATEVEGEWVRSFPLCADADGRLHLSVASATADPRLHVVTLSARGELVELRDDDGGGGSTACLELDVQEGQAIEVRASVPAGDVDGDAQLTASLAVETDVTRAAADELSRRLVAVDLDAADAHRRIEELARELPSEAAAISPALHAVAVRLASLPREVTTVEALARALGTVHAYAATHLPPLHDERLTAASRLAAVEKERGRAERARLLDARVLDAYRRIAPETDRRVQIARLNLAGSLYLLGELEPAAAELRALHHLVEETLPAIDPLVLATRQNLAAVELELGHAARAAGLYADVIGALEASVPDGDVGLASARANRARALLTLRRPEEARAILDRALAVLRAQLPDHDPRVLASERDQAFALAWLGDLAGARVLYEGMAERLLEERPETDPEVLDVLHGLAAVHLQLEHFEVARSLLETIAEGRARLGPAARDELLLTRLHLASTWRELGDLERALTGYEAVLADLPRSLAPTHPVATHAKSGMAVVLAEMGELDRAEPLQRSVLHALLSVLPPTDFQVQRSRNNLAWTLVRRGAEEATADLLRASAAALETRLAELGPGHGPREIEAAVARSRVDVDEALSIVAEMPATKLRDELEAELFGLVASVRSIGLRHRRLWRVDEGASSDPRVEAAVAELEEARAVLVRRSRVGDERVFDAVQRRDAAQRRLREALLASGSTGIANPRLDVAAVAASLEPAEAAVGYWRYERKTYDRETLRLSAPRACYLAYVVRPSGLTRVELGPADVVDAAIEAWHAAVLRGAPGGAGARGVAAAGERPGDGAGRDTAERQAGAALGALLVEPLRAALGDARTVFCAPDDATFLVPFEALPRADGTVLGDTIRFVHRLDATVGEPPGERPAAPGLLAMGGILYDGGAPERGGDRTDAARSSAASDAEAGPGQGRGVLRGDWSPSFAFLPASEAEVRALVRSFEDAFPDAPARVLTGREASRAAFERLAPGARFLHLATHAYFAPESIPSTRDRGRIGAVAMLDTRDQVRGFVPMLLSGLAFAGANASAEGAERRGLLTAEELAGLDLARCELAVLSACETNVGVRRAGQGVASLQTALHAAGARTSITSLWKVPDDATKELMERFYQALWLEGRTKADALWQAKRALRARRDADGRTLHATRDWAAWVLAGDPR